MQTVVSVAAGGIAWLRVAGEIDLRVKADLAQAVFAVIDDGPVGVVVDLTDVTFLDSSGIDVLVQGYQRAVNAATGYRICGAQGIVQRVLTLTGVAEVLETGVPSGRQMGAAATGSS